MTNSNEELKKLNDFIKNSRKDMIALETLLTSVPALAPENGGVGEFDKAEALIKWLSDKGLKNIERYDAPDKRAKNGIRPNIVLTIPGKSDEYSLWIMSHLDVVPPGEISLWNSDPWKVIEKDGKLIGRGVEDNQQGLVSSVFAALAFFKTGITPSHTVKLLFIADEEVGSKYGIKYLLKEHNLFKKQDLILIPDGGDPKGETIEIAEKNILWMRFHTIGKQSHGSMPNKGKNACVAAADLMLRINNLEKRFDKKDDLFDPPYSTFQPTMRLANVSGVNIIPGDDVSCADCRILPCYKIKDVLKEVEAIYTDVEKKYGVKIELELLQAEESPATPADAPIVKKLSKTLKEVHGIKARTIGIGGGTVGGDLRKAGYNAAVWSTLDEVCHQPNEYSVIANTEADAYTMAALMLD
ncbi:M20 family metallo-hydrolase [Treponema parvum]|uniref:M20 family metallo-hydrolase n=1 Tax=Treponema parvum TaxID=138851 RepID=A0A975F1N8_9SPIR|nr:M20 family metallo-hydrolase [Treponema parvum]QTQ12728.1 M20 family metallo-hydrolase [Treponema parvum]